MPRKLTDEVQLKLRFSEKLRRRLERLAAAHKPPRSLNAEIIQRLEQSLEKEDVSEALVDLLGGDDNAKALRSVARTMQAHGGKGESWRKHWRETPAAAEAVHRAVDLVMADLTGSKRAFPPMTAEDFEPGAQPEQLTTIFEQQLKKDEGND